MGSVLADVAGELEVLLLVLADRHVGRLVDQDIGRHQHRIGVEADRRGFTVLARLLLELRHAVHPADAGDAVEHPGKLGMRRHHRLVEDDVLGAVDARGEEGRGDLARLARQHPGVHRHRDGVLVDHAVQALVVVLQAGEVADRAEIVAEMQVAGGLYTGKDATLEAAVGVGGQMRIQRGAGRRDVRHGCGLRSLWRSTGFGPPCVT
jgi:hypothetical protein